MTCDVGQLNSSQSLFHWGEIAPPAPILTKTATLFYHFLLCSTPPSYSQRCWVRVCLSFGITLLLYCDLRQCQHKRKRRMSHNFPLNEFISSHPSSSSSSPMHAALTIRYRLFVHILVRCTLSLSLSLSYAIASCCPERKREKMNMDFPATAASQEEKLHT
jgi:hypothetical protein